MNSADYAFLYDSSSLFFTPPSQLRELDGAIKVALANKTVYRQVQLDCLIPWIAVAAIHLRESSQAFNRHLHNGDPLTARTVNHPAGRPATGTPPYSWRDSAADALKDAWRPSCWDLPGLLEFCERYNGLGYRKRSLNTPYLWNYTDKYRTGLFVKDGSFDGLAKDKAPGCAAFFKRMGVETLASPAILMA